MKVAELSGAELDYWVGMTEGERIASTSPEESGVLFIPLCQHFRNSQTSPLTRHSRLSI